VAPDFWKAVGDTMPQPDSASKRIAEGWASVSTTVVASGALTSVTRSPKISLAGLATFLSR